MKRYTLFTLALALSALAFSVMAAPALADGYDLAVRNTKNFETFSGGAESGDLSVVYDASADKWKTFAQPVLRVATDTVASGQTSKAVTVTGITTTSDCVATANEVATNAVYIRAVVATANTATVTVSGDPGASNLDLTVICAN